MVFKEILFEKKDHYAIIKLNRPKSLNAITSSMLSEINSALNLIKSEGGIRVALLTGHETFFSAGVDIKELATIETPEDAHRLTDHIRRCYNRLAACPIPLVAVVSGVTFGGGLELALACDFIIASDTAKFAFPEIKLGLMPGAGGTQRLPRLIGPARASQMMFTGQPISAQKAMEIGLVNDVIAVDNLFAEVTQMAVGLASKPGVALKMIKDAVQTGIEVPLDSALKYENRCFEMLFSTADQKEGVAAFIEKRRPQFTGS